MGTSVWKHFVGICFIIGFLSKRIDIFLPKLCREQTFIQIIADIYHIYIYIYSNYIYKYIYKYMLYIFKL